MVRSYSPIDVLSDLSCKYVVFCTKLYLKGVLHKSDINESVRTFEKTARFVQHLY